MRRSKSIALLCMAAAPIALSGCDDNSKKQASVGSFATAAECRASGTFTDEQCEAAQRDALGQYEQRAPRYTSREDCETAHGAAACTPRESHGQSWFMPALTGFMVGRMLSGGGAAMPAAPLFSGPSGGFATTSCDRIQRGVATVPAAAAANTMRAASQPARSAAGYANVARGGFGARAESGAMGPTGRGGGVSGVGS
jgi:uncharacterized protein YgiB involved in biofilm formation